MPLELIKEAKSLGIEISAIGGELRVKAAKGALTDEFREKIRAGKKELLALFADLSSVETSGEEGLIRSAPRAQGGLPLSFAQKRLWFIDKQDGGSPQYNIAVALNFRGSFDAGAFRRTLDAIVARHEILRTTYHETSDGTAVQKIRSPLPVPVTEVDLTSLTQEEQDREIDRLFSDETQKAFDLENDPMLRAALVECSETLHVVVFTMHHIASDGWSLGVLAREFVEIYGAERSGKRGAIAPLEIQYADYAHWQQQTVGQERLKRQLDYWVEQLSDLPSVHSLPVDHVRPLHQRFEGRVHGSDLSEQTTLALNKLATSHNVTLFMVLQSAFAVLLSRWGNEEDVVIGSPVSGRTHSQVAPLIGFFVNTLVFRLRVAKDTTFSELLSHNRKVSLDAFSNQDVPFEMLVERLQPERSLSHSPLFQIIFSLQNNEQSDIALPGLVVESRSTQDTSIKFDLELSVREANGRLWLEWRAAKSLFEQSTIVRMAESFNRLVEAIAIDPLAPVHGLPMLGVEDGLKLERWEGGAKDFANDRCIHDLFEAQASLTPDSPALSLLDETLSYRELNERANQVADYLIDRGVGPDSLVAVCIDRSVEMVIALLAILKAGGAYLPLDPRYPATQLEYILEDSGAKLMLVGANQRDLLPSDGRLAVSLDDINLFAHLPASNSQKPAGLDGSNLAYVLYTSGSTGQPKGCLITHAGVRRLVEDVNYVGLGPETVTLLSAPITFDAATFEIWAPLLNGGKLVVYPPNLDLAQLEEFTRRHGVNTLWLTSALFDVWASELKSGDTGLRYLLVGGDVVSPQTVASVYRKDRSIRILNCYGPTECTTFATTYEIPRDHPTDSPVPIGASISHTQCLVLDAGQARVPIGVVGELYLGGQGLARGYLNRPELTAEKFVPHPFSTDPDVRLYRTGDLVRYDESGNLHFVARADEQVKIRGFRIELAGLSAQIAEHPDVRDCAVVAQGHGPNKRLVAYVLRGEGMADRGSDADLADRLREYLRQALAEYMLPAAIVVLDKLPVTANGKLDRKALPVPDFSVQSESGYVAPRNVVEETLCGIWRQLLRAERVGIHDNFFALGGDSILSIQAVSRASQAGIRISTRMLFANQTVAELAVKAAVAGDDLQPQQAVSGDLPLLPIQRAFLSHSVDVVNHFNQALLLTTPREFDLNALVALMRAVYERHDALRLRFHDEPEWVASHAPLTDAMIEQTCVIERLPEDPEEAAQFITSRCNHHQRNLDIRVGPLVRAVYFQGKEVGRLFIVVHHIAVDGVSWRILLADLERGYRQYRELGVISLPPKTSSYQRWTQAISDHARSKDVAKELPYWSTQSRLAVAPFPAKAADAAQVTFANTQIVEIRLSEQETSALIRDCPAAYRTRVNELLLAGVYLGIRRWTGHRSLSVTLESHGREDLFEGIDLTETMGWFTTTYPLLLNPQHDDATCVVKEVKEACRSVPNNGIGFGMLRDIKREPALVGAATSRPELVFNYLGQFDQTVNEASVFQVAPESSGDTISPARCREHQLGLNGMIAGGRLGFSLDYCPAQFEPEAMSVLAGYIEDGLRNVIAHCRSIAQPVLTPSDFPLAELTISELDSLAAGYSIEDLYPATPMQKGMLFHSMLDRSAYVTQIHPVLIGPLDLASFKEAWGQVIGRHAIFRTAFVGEGDHLHQLVAPQCAIVWQEYDWRSMSPDEQATRFENFRRQDKASGFDTARLPLQRFAIFRLGDERTQLLWTHHHMLLDGWSTPLVYRDVMLSYNALIQGEAPAMSPAPEYSHYIAWLKRQDAEVAREYWRQYLANFTSPTSLTLGRSNHFEPKTGFESYRLNAEETDKLQRFAKQQRTTVNTLFQLAWAILLKQYSGSRDVAFGAVISGRPGEVLGIEAMVGLFINTIPVRVLFDEGQPLQGLLTRLHAEFQASSDCGFLSLPDIQAQSTVPGDRALFESLLAFENYPIDAMMETSVGVPPPVTIESVASNEQTSYAVTLSVSIQDELSIHCSYDSLLLSHSAIKRMLRQLEAILRAMAVGEGIDSIPELSEVEAKKLEQWSVRPVPQGLQASVLSLFEEQVAAWPDRIAVCEGDRRTSFAELDRQASILAARLTASGACHGAVVGIHAGRSVEQVVGVLAVLKLGATGFCMDPASSPQELTRLVDRLSPAVIVSQSTEGQVFGRAACSFQVLSDGSDFLRFASTQGNGHGSVPMYIACDQDASGDSEATVPVLGATVLRFLHAMRTYAAPAEPVTLCQAPIGTNLAYLEIFGTLCAGGRLVLGNEPGYSVDVRDRIANDGVTDIYLPSDTFRGFVRRGMAGGLSRLFVFGDEVSARSATQAYGYNSRLAIHCFNGPSEFAGLACEYSFARDQSEESALLIGRPLPGVRCLVLGRDSQRVAPGLIGELCLQVMDVDGAFGLPAVKTGKLVCYREDGNLEFVADEAANSAARQEIRELARRLESASCVGDFAVRREAGGAVAYVVPAEPSADAAVFKREVGTALGTSVGIVRLVHCPEISLTIRGHIDFARLSVTEAIGSDGESARDQEVQETLLGIWRTVLGESTITVSSNFFDVGGNSMKVLEIVAAAKASGIKLNVGHIWKYQTIEAISSTVTPVVKEDVRIELPGEPLEPLQRELIERGRRDPMDACWTVVAPVDPEFTETHLRHAVRALVDRNPRLNRRIVSSGQIQYLADIRDARRGLRSVVSPTTPAVPGQELVSLISELTSEVCGSEQALFRVMLVSGPGPVCLLVVHRALLNEDAWGSLAKEFVASCAAP